MTDLPTAFRLLRSAWFNRVLRHDPPEREWIDEDAEREIAERNSRLRKVYDDQTERIITGHDLPVSPFCPVDMDH